MSWLALQPATRRVCSAARPLILLAQLISRTSQAASTLMDRGRLGKHGAVRYRSAGATHLSPARDVRKALSLIRCCAGAVREIRGWRMLLSRLPGGAVTVLDHGIAF
jgi:hypothetical protein